MFEVDPVIDNRSWFREGILDTEAPPSKMSKVEASKSIDNYGKQKDRKYKRNSWSFSLEL